jgi:HSP20 family protein
MSEQTEITTGSPERRSQSAGALLPPVDVIEDESGITLTADLPGVAKDSLGVKVNGDNLLIEAGASIPVPQDMDLLYAEIRAPYCRRSFTLSRELDASKVEANLKDGVLKLRIPKAEHAKPRRIEVRVD